MGSTAVAAAVLMCNAIGFVAVCAIALGLAMWFSGFWIILPALAVAGSLAAKRVSPTTSRKLPTHSPVFVLMLVAVVVIVGALTFVPALALGPVVEHLLLQ